MSRKVKPKYVIIVLLLIGLALLGVNIFSFSYDARTIDEDFTNNRAVFNFQGDCKEEDVSTSFYKRIKCQDKDFEVNKMIQNKRREGCDGQSSNTYLESGNLILKNYGGFGESSYLLYKKDYKHRDFLVKGKLSIQGGYRSSNTATAYFYLNNKLVASKSISAEKDQNSRGTYNEVKYILEVTESFNDKNKVIVSLDREDIGEFEIPEEKINIKVSLGNGQGCYQDNAEAKVYIDEFRSASHYRCNLDKDEIFYTDRFGEGTKIKLYKEVGDSADISYLSKKPLAFCPDTKPIIKRSLKDKGSRSDERGQIFNDLANGKTIQVPKGEYYEIYYIVDYTQGMKEFNCEADSYYLNGKCEKTIFQEEDKEDFRTETTLINVGNEQVSFINNGHIGDIPLNSKEPKYSCSKEKQKAYAPYPRTECWKIPITINSQEAELIYNQDYQLNKYFKVKAITEAQFEDNKISNYKNTLIATIDNGKFVTIKDLSTKNTFNRNEGINLQFEVNNDLANFKVAGLKINKKGGLLLSEETRLVQNELKLGINTINVNMQESKTGKYELEITPYYVIGDKIMSDDETINKNIEIVETTAETKDEKQSFLSSLVQKIKDFFKRLWG